MGMTSILLWIYLFGWKSLITFPLWILGIYIIIKIIAHWKTAFRLIIGLFVLPFGLIGLIYWINHTAGLYVCYASPILYALYIWGLYKMGDADTD